MFDMDLKDSVYLYHGINMQYYGTRIFLSVTGISDSQTI